METNLVIGPAFGSCSTGWDLILLGNFALSHYIQVFAYAGDRLILISPETDNNGKWIPSEVDVLVKGKLQLHV